MVVTGPVRRAFVASAAAAAVACGLSVTGLGTSEPDDDAGVEEAGAPPADATPDVDRCREGVFCDPCDPTLLLCLTFEGDITDESPHGHVIRVDGGAAFVPGMSGNALALDGGTFILVPASPAIQATSELTIEMWMRVSQLPPSGGRSGLADRNGVFGFFLQPNGELTCTPGTARGPVDAGGGWNHVACVIGQGKTMLYVGGAPVSESEAGPPAASEEPIVIGANSPSGDPFLGELDSLRIYARAKLTDEIAAAAAE